MWLQIFYFKTQREPHRALVLSRLRLSRSTDHQDPVSENERFFALQILQRYLTKEGRV